MCIRDRQATVRRHLTPILLLLLAGGYLVILGELFLYQHWDCLLYTSDAADERSSVDLGGRRIIKKKKKMRVADDGRQSE